MMGTWLPETCWATIRREIKNTKSVSSWFFLSTLNYDARSTTHHIHYFNFCIIFSAFKTLYNWHNVISSHVIDKKDKIILLFVGIFLFPSVLCTSENGFWYKPKHVAIRISSSKLLNTVVMNCSFSSFPHTCITTCRSWWLRRLWQLSAAARLLRSWFRNPRGGIDMSVVIVACCRVEL